MSVRCSGAPEASPVPARSYLQEHGVRNVLHEAVLHEAVLHEAVLHEAALHEAALHEAVLRNLHNARRGHPLVVAHTALLDLEQLHKEHKDPLVDAVRLRTELRVSARKDHCLPRIELPVVGALLRDSPTAMGGTGTSNKPAVCGGMELLKLYIYIYIYIFLLSKK